MYRGGVSAVATWKITLTTTPSERYGLEFTAFSIMANFSEISTSTMAHIPGSDEACVISLKCRIWSLFSNPVIHNQK